MMRQQNRPLVKSIIQREIEIQMAHGASFEQVREFILKCKQQREARNEDRRATG